jgi:hypothetical protein
MVRPMRLVVREVAPPPWAAAVGRDSVVSSALAPTLHSTLDTGGFAPDVLKAAVHFVGDPTLRLPSTTLSSMAGAQN